MRLPQGLVSARAVCEHANWLRADYTTYPRVTSGWPCRRMSTASDEWECRQTTDVDRECRQTTDVDRECRQTTDVDRECRQTTDVDRQCRQVTGSRYDASCYPCPDGGIGRRDGFKIRCPKGRVGSSPTPGTESVVERFLIGFADLTSPSMLGEG